MVGQVEGLDPDLEIAFAEDVEGPEDACVDTSHAGSTELVAMRVAKVRRHNLRR